MAIGEKSNSLRWKYKISTFFVHSVVLKVKINKSAALRIE